MGALGLHGCTAKRRGPHSSLLTCKVYILSSERQQLESVHHPGHLNCAGVDSSDGESHSQLLEVLGSHLTGVTEPKFGPIHTQKAPLNNTTGFDYVHIAVE